MSAGPPPPPVPALLRAQDRTSFVYLEHATVHRESNAVTATDSRGTVHIPAATLGTLPARVRDLLWETTVELVGGGRAILVHSTRGEQRLAFRVHHHAWEPTDFDGVQLMMRPRTDDGEEVGTVRPRAGWSNARRRRR